MGFRIGRRPKRAAGRNEVANNALAAAFLAGTVNGAATDYEAGGVVSVDSHSDGRGVRDTETQVTIPADELPALAPDQINAEPIEDGRIAHLVLEAGGTVRPAARSNSVAELREARGWDVERLAREAMIPAALVTQIEAGRYPSQTARENLAAVLETPADQLFAGAPLETAAAS